jgi:PEP-CTERM motif
LISSVTEFFGYDFAGTPNPPQIDPYPLASLFLRVEALGTISRLEISAERKFGIDTFEFGVTNLPEPSTLGLIGLGLLGLGGMRRRRRNS